MIKNIILDWSGTISDDFIIVYKTTNLVFQELDLPKISEEEFKREFTLPYMNFWRKYIPNAEREKLQKIYAKAFEQVEDQPQIYPGVQEVLQRLHSSGKKLAILSTHVKEKIKEEATEYGIHDIFLEINGGIHDKRGKIMEIMERNGFNPEETMYIGDMVHDIETGKLAGVTTVALTWGYQDEEVLKPHNADHYLDSLDRLEDLVA